MVKALKKYLRTNSTVEYYYRECIDRYRIKSTEDINLFLSEIGNLTCHASAYAVLSTNPIDYFTASAHASFTSCYNPEGAYYNGTIANAIDGYTLVFYTVKSKDDIPSDGGFIKNKLGRSWIQVNCGESPYLITG